MSNDPVNVSPAQRLRRWHAYLIVWTAHRWLGLALGLVLLVVSLSGALLVAHHELEGLLAPESRIVTPPADLARAEIAPIAHRLLTEAPAGSRPLRIEFGHDASDADKYVFVGADRKTRWSAFVNPYTGATLWSGADLSTPSSWLLALHMHFHAGRWGHVLGGLAGLALTLLGVTGLYLHRDTLRGVLRHPFRLRLGWRVALADLHKWIGLTGIYFTLVLGGTGLWYACLIIPRQFAAAPTTAPAPFDFARLTALEPALATASAKFPGAEIFRLQFPTDAKAPLSVRVLHRGEPVWQKFSHLDFDPVTGALRKTTEGRLADGNAKLNAILAPLHFGFYGSTLTKWLYVFGGLSPAILSLTGFAIWWLRRRNKSAAGQPPASGSTASVSANPLPAR